MTRETVMGETPARRATSWIVTAVPLRRPDFTSLDMLTNRAASRCLRLILRRHRILFLGASYLSFPPARLCVLAQRQIKGTSRVHCLAPYKRPIPRYRTT